jgi:beta-glucosidase
MISFKNSVITFWVLTVIFVAFSCRPKTTRSESSEGKLRELISKMTLDEKLGQMTQVDPAFAGGEEQLKKAVRDGRYGSFLNFFGAERVNEIQKIAIEESRLGIPLLIGRDVIHGYRTIFPIPLGMAASWNPEMIKKAFRISSIEASSQGIRWSFAPMIDISWDPRWGRIAEGCGEDPYLASVLAKAMVEGIQGDDLKDPTSVAACAKHFAGYGFAEGGRDYNTTYIPETLLRNVVLKPFKAAADAGALTFMTAFNDLNGVPASGNAFTVRKILRDEWKYKGMVVSDWSSVTEMINHGFCANEKEAAQKAISAGVEMEMSSSSFSSNSKQLLSEGKITLAMIDDAVMDILKVKSELGLFENPYVNPESAKEILSPVFLDHARKVACQSIVLLKNNQKCLPLSQKIGSVAVMGPLANSQRDQLGTWVFDGKAENSVTPLHSLKEILGVKRVNYVPGLSYSRDKNKTEFRKCLSAAHAADAVLFFAGEEWILSGEGQSRGEINLPGVQDELLAELAKTGKPLIVVVMAGRPLAIGNALSNSSALLYAWHGGTMSGPAITDILFGVESPSGKLPVTFVKGSGQIPFYYYRNNTGRPASEKSFTPMDSIPKFNPQSSLGYRSFHLDYGFTPLLPFGYGLSYTTFEYNKMTVSSLSMALTGSVKVSATVTNTGDTDADEIVQLYVRDRVGSITRPIKELKGFSRVHIRKGEKVSVEFNISAKDLEFYNGIGYITEPGEFDVWIGADSERGLHGEFAIQ